MIPADRPGLAEHQAHHGLIPDRSVPDRHTAMVLDVSCRGDSAD